MAKGSNKTTLHKGTADRIIEAAEKLYAKHGVGGVSLRQIGTAAGCANKYAVQYHFGDQQRLIQAIFEKRLPALEVHRASLLLDVQSRNALSCTSDLIAVQFESMAELLDDAGRCSFAAFVDGLRYFDGIENARLEYRWLAPLSSHIADLICASVPHVPQILAMERFVRVFFMFLRSLREWEDARERRESFSVDRAEFVAEMVAIGAAAVAAPVSEAMKTNRPAPLAIASLGRSPGFGIKR